MARVAIPGLPRHPTQRGNRRMKTFMCEKDCDAHLHESDEAWDSIRRHERTERPPGSPEFAAGPEKMAGRSLAKRPPGPEPRRSRR